MSHKKTILLIGSLTTSLHAAASARRWHGDAHILVIDDNKDFSWQEEEFCKRHHIARRVMRIIRLDPDANCLIAHADGKDEHLRYDALILTGSRAAFDHDIDGIDPHHVIGISDIDSKLKNPLPRAIIIGAGVAGVKAALQFKNVDMVVRIIEKQKRILPEFSLAFSLAALSALKREHVDVVLGATIESGRDDGHSLELLLSSGQRFVTDLLIKSAGFRPKTTVLADAGCALDHEGFVRVDEFLATTLPKVFACGNAIKIPVVHSDEHKAFTSKELEAKTACIAGANAFALPHQKLTLSPMCQTANVTIGELSFARTGLKEEDARRLCGDDNVVVITVYEHLGHAHCVRLLFEAESQELLGAEIFGDAQLASRIDLLSHAVRTKCTPDVLLDMQMSSAQERDALAHEPLREAFMRAQFHFAHRDPILSSETLALWLASGRDFRLVDVSAQPSKIGRSLKQMVHVPLAQLRQEPKQFINSDQPIVLYAERGDEMHMAQRALIHSGHKNVYSLDGGLMSFSLLFGSEM